MSVDVPDNAVCMGCGYALRGLPVPRCPECGRAFDPNDPNSFGPRPVPQWLRYWLEDPPSWQIGVVIGVFFLCLVLHALVWPSSDGLELVRVFQVLILSVVLIEYTMRLCVGAVFPIARWAFGWREGTRRRRRWRWYAAPACCVLTIVSWVCPLPSIVRFQLSRPAFEAAYRANRKDWQSFPSPRRVGLYYVDSLYTYNGFAAFHISSWGASWTIIYNQVKMERGVCGDLGRGWYVRDW